MLGTGFSGIIKILIPVHLKKRRLDRYPTPQMTNDQRDQANLESQAEFLIYLHF
jgi:hypothetical protein